MEKDIRKIAQIVKNKNYNKQLEEFNYMDNKDLENEIAKIKEIKEQNQTKHGKQAGLERYVLVYELL